MALISVALHFRGDPDSVLNLAYFLPIAEAASTLSVRWSIGIAMLAVFGATAATYHQSPEGPLGAVFRLYFLVVMALLLALEARMAAELRADAARATERNRIALEMHDGLQAELVSLASQAELAMRVAPKVSARAATLCASLREGARQAADSVRFLAHRLRAPELDSGFLPALRAYIYQMEERIHCAITMEVTGAQYPLRPDVEHALFRIIQEGLTNVQKHTRGDQAQVAICFERDALRCTISDAGDGFTLGHENGLCSMRMRTEAVGGCFEVQSAPGAGTTVRVSVPRPAAVKPREMPGSEGATI